MKRLTFIAITTLALLSSTGMALARQEPLPLNRAVEITSTPKKSGQLRYACAADMVAGVILVD